MRLRRQLAMILVVLALALVSSIAGAATINVTCTDPGDLQAAVNLAQPFDTLLVSGTCTGPVLSVGPGKNGLVLDGQGQAVIQDLRDPPAGAVAISVSGASQVVITNFAGITTNTTDGTGIYVAEGASVRINNNTISGNQDGVEVKASAAARIVNNTITGNSSAGILVSETASARIGINAINLLNPTVYPNTIQGNGVGIMVWRGASARIISNTISNNTGSGVDVRGGSSAELASNTIAGNGQDGISVSRNSTVLLGQDTGTGPFNDPNSGSNSGSGISCSINSSADGRLGTLRGTGPSHKAAKNFDNSCVDSLLP
jgi:parallel beta-helix repeat protein